MKIVVVQEQGNSLIVTIPKEIAVEQNLRKGDKVLVESHGNSMIRIRRADMAVTP